MPAGGDSSDESGEELQLNPQNLQRMNTSQKLAAGDSKKVQIEHWARSTSGKFGRQASDAVSGYPNTSYRQLPSTMAANAKQADALVLDEGGSDGAGDETGSKLSESQHASFQADYKRGKRFRKLFKMLTGTRAMRIVDR